MHSGRTIISSKQSSQTLNTFQANIKTGKGARNCKATRSYLYYALIINITHLNPQKANRKSLGTTTFKNKIIDAV